MAESSERRPLEPKPQETRYAADNSNDVQRVIFGTFGHEALGITLQNLGSYADRAEAAIERVNQSDLSPAELREAGKQLHKDFNLYYRVRAHEREHWYTSVSSSVMVARLFANGDTSKPIQELLPKIIAESNAPIYLPLGRWVQRGDCPKDLRNLIIVYNLNRYVTAAIDGILLPEHMLSPEVHLLNAYFHDLKRLGHYWHTSAYRIGLLPLVEGAGKAAEWLYFLLEDSRYENAAAQDLASAAPVYTAALNELTSAVPGRSLLEYLQTLAVLIDIALNPFVSDESWPFLWGTAKGADVLPGFRFKRLIDVAKRYPRFEAGSKESIATFFGSATADEYGWESAAMVNQQLMTLVQQAPPSTTDPSYWDPVGTILKAAQTKIADPLAYVPPVNATAIGASKTYPPIMLTQGSDWAPSTDVLNFYLTRDLDANFLYDIVNIGKLRCPVSKNVWFSTLVEQRGECLARPGGLFDKRQAERGCPSAFLRDVSPGELLECELYGAMLTRFLRGALHRVRFIEGDGKE